MMKILRKIQRWASHQNTIVTALLVGSYAHGTATEDSDIDIMIITLEKTTLIDSKEWLNTFGVPRRVDQEEYGPVTSLRTVYDTCEIEFSIAGPDWLKAPLDPGTEKVLGDGFRIIYTQSKTHSTLLKELSGLQRKGTPKLD
jgi:hypothetical protein